MDPLAIYRRDIARYRTSDDLVLRNLALALWLAGRFCRPGISQADLIGAANVGLLNARANYDESKGKFATYASRCIVCAIQDEIRKLHGTMIVGRQRYQRGQRASAVETQTEHASHEPTPAEQAEHADDLAQLPKAMARLQPRERSILNGLMADKNGEQIGGELGITRERVRQLKCRSFAELRAFYFGDGEA